jgi:outer membrane protein assembly factor BamD (BamD/ComL family)
MIERPNTVAVAWAVLLLVSPWLSVAEGGFEWRGKWVRSGSKSEVGPDGQLAAIRQLVDKEHHAKVVKAAKAFIKKHPEHRGCEEAMMLAGESELARGRYYQAFEWFEKQLARYPSGKYFQRSLGREFSAAEAFLAGKKRIVWGFIRLPAKEDGLDILSRIAEHSPKSAIAAKAIMRIADYHYKADEYTEAVNAYDRYVETFKNSPDCWYAMLQAARATRAQFAGIKFDETPLVEAEQRFKAFAERFPRAAKKENISKTLNEIADTLAEKLYACGKYYVRVGKPSAAAFYYKQVLDRYGRTAWARQARQSLNGLGHIKPVQPSNGKFMLLNPPRPTTRPSRPPADSAGGSPPSRSATTAGRSRIKR